MAPEQAGGTRADHRCDVFALGAVAFRAMTGQPPFVGESAPVTLFRIVHWQPPRPSGLLGYVGSYGNAFDAVFAIVLAKDPSARFASAGEFAEALAAAARGELSPDHRGRASAILRTAPWGEQLTMIAE